MELFCSSLFILERILSSVVKRNREATREKLFRTRYFWLFINVMERVNPNNKLNARACETPLNFKLI